MNEDDALSLGTARVGGTTLDLTFGIGSGLFHAKGDPENVFYALTDRGPNLDRDDAAAMLSIEAGLLGADGEAGKVFPLPAFAPAIFKIELGEGGAIKVLERITLADAKGKPITGLPNPLKAAPTEIAFDKHGRRLGFDPNGLDTEGIVRLSDGSFWLADEYAPSLVHVSATGRIMERLVPVGIEADLAGAAYKITGSLPAILAKRHINRGFEGVALSPDEAHLYALMQSPLANPDDGAYTHGVATRILKIEASSGRLAGEFFYLLDAPDTFANDLAPKRQSDVRLSEITGIGPDKLIVLERISKTSKLYLVDLTSGSDILGTAWDDVATSPSLEQIAPADLAKHGLVPVAKTLWLNSKDWAELPKRIEGISVPTGGSLVVINDNDFGIDGADNRILRVRLALPHF